MQVFLQAARLQQLRVREFARRHAVAMHAAFFVYEQRERRHRAAGRGRGACYQEQVRRLDPSASCRQYDGAERHAGASGERAHAPGSRAGHMRAGRLHTLTATPPRRGSPARAFGIVWLSDQELKQVGCACEIERVLERTSDGRMNILARAKTPFRLLERREDLPYPAGVVEFLGDVEEEADERAARDARELYRELVEQATDERLQDEALSKMDAYRMAATVEFGCEAKQELLELRSENERLRLLTLLLQAAIARLELAERAQARARSNGKVRFN